MGGKTYQGAPCKKGHSGERYIRNDSCAECHRKKQADWAARNYLRILKKNAEWQRNHLHNLRARVSRRRALRLQATPAWLTPEQRRAIDEIYMDAQTRPGGPWHVDHIVPLKGREVCGLHVPWNLQILTASENQRKGNKLTVA